MVRVRVMVRFKIRVMVGVRVRVNMAMVSGMVMIRSYQRNTFSSHIISILRLGEALIC